MTLAEMQTLKALAEADPVAAAYMANAEDIALAAWFNTLATPTFVVWRTSLSRETILHSVSPEATSFQWNGNGYITRGQGERDAFREMFDAQGNCNPSLTNVQAAINDIFSGTGGGAANKAHFLAHAKRTATRAEKALATGTGTTVAPGFATFEGEVSFALASQIRSV